MRKNSVFWAFFARRSAKSVRKKCFFHVFWDTLSKFAKKAFFFARRYAKSVSVLSRFSRHFVQSSQKSRKKKTFFEFFLQRSQKIVRKQCFSRFSRHFVQSLQKKGLKQRFLSDFMQGVWENSVLSRFRDTLYKVRRKWEKSAFFARRYAKSVRKQCSFTFFKTLCTKFAENKQNQRILSFFCDVPQNVWVNSVFSRLLRHFVQSSQKMRKTAFFELFARRSAKSVKKRCFFTFFERHFVQSSQKKWKNSFFFAQRYAKSMTKQCSFTFFKTLCTKFAENEKNQRILSFFCDVPQKVWVNSVFSRLLRHFVQSTQKMRKTAFLSFFCVVPRKVWENCVFH